VACWRRSTSTEETPSGWSIPYVGGYTNKRKVDIGGPLEIVVGSTPPNEVGVFDADGNLLWQTPGEAYGVDPNGDVLVTNESKLASSSESRLQRARDIDHAAAPGP
jgi:hypothetical protein